MAELTSAQKRLTVRKLAINIALKVVAKVRINNGNPNWCMTPKKWEELVLKAEIGLTAVSPNLDIETTPDLPFDYPFNEE